MKERRKILGLARKGTLLLTELGFFVGKVDLSLKLHKKHLKIYDLKALQERKERKEKKKKKNNSPIVSCFKLLLFDILTQERPLWQLPLQQAGELQSKLLPYG